MQNVQFYIGLVVFFAGSVWAVLAFGRSILERRAIRAGVTANFGLANDRHAAAKHRAATVRVSESFTVRHREPVSLAVSYGHSDRNRDRAAVRAAGRDS